MRIIVLLTTLILSACAVPPKTFLESSDTQKISDAIRTDNLAAIEQIFDKIPAEVDKRSGYDKGMIDQALQLTAAKGESCNMKIADYLYAKGALADYYNMLENNFGSYRSEYQRYKIPFCGDFLMDSHKKFLSMKPPMYVKPAEHVAAVKNNFIKHSYNNLVEFFNSVDYKKSDDLTKGIKVFLELSKTAVAYGKEACAKDAASAGCISFGYFKKLPEELLAKKDFSKKSDSYRLLKEFSDNLSKMIN